MRVLWAFVISIGAGYLPNLGSTFSLARTLGLLPFFTLGWWLHEHKVVERFAAAGIAREKISFARDTYTFKYPARPAELLSAFRHFYGPTMNAFEAAEKNGRADDLAKELGTLFVSQNESPRPDATSIPATFLRVTVSV